MAACSPLAMNSVKVAAMTDGVSFLA